MEINKKAKKKLKGFNVSQSDETHGQCNFFLQKKGRLCRFKANLGQQYCPEHACIMGVQTERKRIPCPLNPKHNCYEDELEKHIKKCNVTKIQQKVEQEVYFVKGVNKDTSGCHIRPSSESQTSVKDLTSEDLSKLIEKVKSLYNAQVEDIESTYLQHPCVQDEICPSGQENIKNVLKNQAALRKELLQQAALVGQMEKEKFLDHEKSCFVELGAGKGKLSHWIRKACNQHSNTKFVLVERGSVRYKVDGHQEQNEDGDNFKRIKMDIADLYLGKVPGLDGVGAVTIVGKHLCGGATDMGIRCAVNTLLFDQQKSLSDSVGPSQPFTKDNRNVADCSGCDNSLTVMSMHSDADSKLEHQQTKPEQDHDHMQLKDKKNEDSISSAEPPAKVQKIGQEPKAPSRLPDGILIALCCHHQCTWETYTGKSFMEACGVGPQEFDLLTRLSSWATCAKVRGRSTENSNSGSQVDASKHQGQTNTSEDSLSSHRGDKDDHFSEDLMNLQTNSSNQPLREQLSVSEREKIGRQCKRLIDTGRLHYLRSKGMKASLREYIEEDTTPENVILVAHI